MNTRQGLPAASSGSKSDKIGVLQYELDYRRNKQGSIFSWSSAILVTIIGGVILLTRDPGHAIPPNQKIFISAAIIGITFFAVMWLGYNADRESVTATQLEHLSGCGLGDKKDGKANEPTTSLYVGYRVALVLLAVAALFVTWYWK